MRNTFAAAAPLLAGLLGLPRRRRWRKPRAT